MKLFTGGKGVAGRQNLFVIHAAAVEILDKYARPACRDFTWGGDVRERPIQPPDIKIMGKNLDSDGNLYVTLPDDDVEDITPQVDGVDFYAFFDLGVTLVQPSLSLISIDASDPVDTVVTYRLETNGVVCNAIVAPGHFTAPGVNTTRSVSGTFAFTYNQHNLSKTENSSRNCLNLEVDTRPQKCTSSCQISVALHHVSAENIAWVRVPVQEEAFSGLFLVPLTHVLAETFWCVSYCIPTTGKTLWVGQSIASLSAPEADAIPTELAVADQTHLYRGDDGDHLSQSMTLYSGGTIGPPNTISYESSNDEFFLPNMNLSGVAILGNIFFTEDGNLVGALPSVIPPSNMEISVGLQCN